MSDEQDILRRLDKIEEKLDILNAKVLSQHLCQTPNTCIRLVDEIKQIKTNQNHTLTRIERLEKWQVWITGIGVTLIFFLTFFGPVIRKYLNLE